MEALAITWGRLHTGSSTPVTGPMGETNCAFIENRSFLDASFVLCVSDWPHTFTKPVQLGEVLPSEGPAGRMFWSLDGTVLAVRDDVGYSAWMYSSAYDFENHEVVRCDSDRIAALLASRGGLGPEHDQYPTEKGGC
ncbi:MAG: hypothetical protein EOP83_19940 [Verrucomicrobiaceae bacterium]|nr:MAG: hypothetical protein EOP83_19940 [Verrucomicrobiaceae bacterium]